MSEQIPLLKVSVPTGQLITLSLDQLQEDTHGASNRLKASLRCAGQLEPILIEERPNGTYHIRDGNRRVQAARSLLWTEIEAEVYQGLTETEWALVIAGTHNRSANPVEEARLYRELGKTLTIEGISANTGHPIQVIKARLALLHLPDDVLDLVGTRTLSLGIAERAARLQGVHAQQAVSRVRQAAQNDQAFTAKALKEITTARARQLGTKLLAAAPPPPTLVPAAEVLALEVKDLCQRRGVDLQALLRELQTPAPMTLPAGGTAARMGLN